ncbi:hypothetical protein NJBCHELONAE_48990 [Mycobacteroides chelonae]|uniref:type II toxin-antitoxin system RelE family toxin n=1 Tax=Mycobacteroides chelonae TaxID=1774 RepID=UPI0021DD5A33|nr:type II toxin-antitoxin system RelE/ParE family toxin [Mycobacteroides chelonae]GLE59586.1 hypothetical protein NJBCHELONAE_48990 [Mycobacteroides chelonae]
MTYHYELTEDAQEDLRDLDGSARVLVYKALDKLCIAPEQYGNPLGKRGASNLTGFRKLIVGKKAYRVLYLVSDKTVVVVWVIAARADDEVYELANARLKAMADRGAAEALEQLLVTAWKGSG